MRLRAQIGLTLRRHRVLRDDALEDAADELAHRGRRRVDGRAVLGEVQPETQHHGLQTHSVERCPLHRASNDMKGEITVTFLTDTATTCKTKGTR